MPYVADGSLEDLIDRTAGAFVEEAPERIVSAVADAFVDEVARRTPRDEGHDSPYPPIADQWGRTRVRREGDVYSAEVFNRDRRVVLVEHDVRPHEIRPKRRDALILPGGLLRAVVRHPGSQGAHMLRDAAAWIEVNWRRIAERELDKLAVELNARR